MGLVVEEIRVGARLVDTVAQLGPTELARLRDDGIEGVVAYLGGNLTAELVANATSLQMGIVPVNFAHKPGTVLTEGMGALEADASVRRLSALGLPVQGLIDWCDLEGVGADPTAYLDAWSAAVVGSGRIAGLYVGAGGLLTAAQLFALPHFSRYWHSLSRGIPEPGCGFVMAQLYPTTSRGQVEVDVDFVQHDFLGRTATWIRSQA